jgi:hypothetical protein
MRSALRALLKLTRVTLAVTAFELAPDVQTLMDTGRLADPKLYSSGPIALCQQCADIVEEDGGEIRDVTRVAIRWIRRIPRIGHDRA